MGLRCKPAVYGFLLLGLGFMALGFGFQGCGLGFRVGVTCHTDCIQLYGLYKILNWRIMAIIKL